MSGSSTGSVSAFGALRALLLLLLFLTIEGVADAQPPIEETLGIGLRENLGAGVNSEWAEFVPVLAPDGKRLYFDRKHAPGNVGGKADQDDIYYSDLMPDGTWGPAVNLGAPMNTPGSDVLFWISPDGDRALLYHGKMVNGREQGLSFAQWSNGRWGEPSPISIEGLEHLGFYYYAHMSTDGKLLLLAYADRKDTIDLNLFYCTSLNDENTKWSKPEPLHLLNTPFIEGSPFLSRDQRTLYFISDRPSEDPWLSDIYFSRRINEEWYWWTPPERIGFAVNSPMFESGVSLSPDEKTMFVSRIAKEPDSFGRTDLFSHTFPDTLRSLKTFVLNGRITDAVTGKGLPGSVSTNLLERSSIYVETPTDAEGNFALILPPGSMLVLRADVPGYDSAGITFDARRINPLATISPITIALRRIGTKPLPNEENEWTILFATGNDRPEGRAAARTIDAVVRRLGGGSARISVSGYTDSVGTEEENIALSRRRAENVAAMLVARGIPRDRIAIVARGEAHPAEDNASARGRSRSRRVVIMVE